MDSESPNLLFHRPESLYLVVHVELRFQVLPDPLLRQRWTLLPFPCHRNPPSVDNHPWYVTSSGRGSNSYRTSKILFQGLPCHFVNRPFVSPSNPFPSPSCLIPLLLPWLVPRRVELVTPGPIVLDHGNSVVLTYWYRSSESTLNKVRQKNYDDRSLNIGLGSLYKVVCILKTW